MSNKESFENVYKNLQEKQTGELGAAIDRANAENKKRRLFSIILFLILGGLFIYGKTVLYSSMDLFNTIQSNEYGTVGKMMSIMTFIIPLMVISVFTYAIPSLIFSKERRKVQKIFKQSVIKDIISNFYDKLTYIPDGKMPSQIYQEAKYKEYYNRYYSDDYIEAELENKYPIKMAEVTTQEEETHTDSDGSSHTTTTTIFHGLFAKIIIDKSIKSELIIKQNRAVFGKNKLEMDSAEFEKYFDVSATNKIIGMQILTADIMEVLVDFQNRTGLKYDISIYNNVIYLRFHSGAVFELNNFKKGMLPKETIRRYYNILNFTYKLSKKLIDVINETEI